MTTLNRNPKGFSFVGILLILVVIGVVVFAGLKVYDLQNPSNTEDTATTQSSATTQAVTAEDVPNKVETASDLAATEQLLNSASADSDMSSIDSDMSTF